MTRSIGRAALCGLLFANALASGCSSPRGEDPDSGTPGGDGGNSGSGDGSARIDGQVLPDGGTPGGDGATPTGDGGGTGTDGGGTCTNACAPGATQCATGGVQTCMVGVGGCTVWSAPIACPANQTCSGGVCATQCTDQCTDGQARCASGSSRQTCARQANGCLDWGTSMSCGASGACNGGMCMDICQNQCTPNQRRCASGTGYQQCVLGANGCYDYGPSTACMGTQTCSGGMCQDTCTDQCTTENARRCVTGTAAQTCSRQANGCLDWGAQQACPGTESCTGAGVCAATCTNQCTLNERRCAGQTGYQTCAMQATGCTDWSPQSTCAANQTCSGAGVCQACTTGQTRCGTNNDVQSCQAGNWVSTAGCPFGCNAGMCTQTVTCTAGAYRCNGNVVEVCNSSGTAYLALQTCTATCMDGGCTGMCTAGARRCNGAFVETCNAGGTAWDRAATACTTFCDSGACVPSMLDISVNTDRDGEIVVAGPVIIRAGVTLRSPMGNLTIRATSITLEAGATILIAATGDDPAGRGSAGGTPGCSSSNLQPGGGGTNAVPWAQSSAVGPGGRGGVGGFADCGTGVHIGGSGGPGGGVLRLIADSVTIGGTITANGTNGGAPTMVARGGGGGGGGGILIAGDRVDIRAGAMLSVDGGPGGTGGTYGPGNAGQPGRIKVLSGTSRMVMGTLSGNVTQGQLPPLTVTSSTHPNPNLFYNDDFASIGFTYNRAYPTRQGYYWVFNTTQNLVPTPATMGSMFTAAELVSVPRAGVANGSNYFHVTPVDPTSNVGTVETAFRVQVNAAAPTLTSSSHPNQTMWSANNNPFFSWTVVNGDQNYNGFWYVFDRFGNTIPTAADTFLPITQKQILRSGVANGIWYFHVVSVDTQGRPTRLAAHYQVRIGADPGNGTIIGTVRNGSTALSGATVTVNRGIFTQTTNATGSYNHMTIPAGTWEVTASAPGLQPQSRMVTVMPSVSSTQDFTLMP